MCEIVTVSHVGYFVFQLMASFQNCIWEDVKTAI